MTYVAFRTPSPPRRIWQIDHKNPRKFVNMIETYKAPIPDISGVKEVNCKYAYSKPCQEWLKENRYCNNCPRMKTKLKLSKIN